MFGPIFLCYIIMAAVAAMWSDRLDVAIFWPIALFITMIRWSWRG